MPSNYTGNPTGVQAPGTAPSLATYPVQAIPVDGDPGNAATFAQSYKVIADNVAYLLDRHRDLLFGSGVDGALTINSGITVNMTGMKNYSTVSVTFGALATNGWPVIARTSITVSGSGSILGTGGNATTTVPGGAFSGGGACGPHMDVSNYPVVGLTAFLSAINTKSIYGLGGAGGKGGGTGTSTPTVISPGSSIFQYPYRFHGGGDVGETLTGSGGLVTPRQHYDAIRGGSAGLPGDSLGGGSGPPGAGGSLVVLIAPQIILNNTSLSSNGGNGNPSGGANSNGGGGGGGGAFLFIGQVVTQTSMSYNANAGTGGIGTGTGAAGSSGTAGNTTPYVVLVP